MARNRFFMIPKFRASRGLAFVALLCLLAIGWETGRIGLEWAHTRQFVDLTLISELVTLPPVRSAALHRGLEWIGQQPVMLILMLAFIALSYRSEMLGERDYLRSKKRRSAEIENNARILKTLPWQPQRDDLDAIVRDALAWERALATRTNDGTS